MKTCDICYEDVEEGMLAPGICTEDCNPTVCQSCAEQHFQTIIEGGFDGACPKMRCYGCTKVVPKAEWGPLVPSHLVELFERRARLLVTIQCGSCHTRRDQFVPSTLENAARRFRVLCQIVDGGDVESKEDASKTTMLIEEHGGESSTTELSTMFEQYERGDIREDDFFEFLYIVFPILMPTDEGAKGLDSEELQMRRWEVMSFLLEAIGDDERRACLEVKYLRFFPHVRTFCCERWHCFKCKIKDFHVGQTCDEYQAANSSALLTCPQCGIYLVRGDGCNSITCVCKYSFNWRNRVMEMQRLAIEAFKERNGARSLLLLAKAHHFPDRALPELMENPDLVAHFVETETENFSIGSAQLFLSLFPMCTNEVASLILRSEENEDVEVPSLFKRVIKATAAMKACADDFMQRDVQEEKGGRVSKYELALEMANAMLRTKKAMSVERAAAVLCALRKLSSEELLPFLCASLAVEEQDSVEVRRQRAAQWLFLNGGNLEAASLNCVHLVASQEKKRERMLHQWEQVDQQGDASSSSSSSLTASFQSLSLTEDESKENNNDDDNSSSSSSLDYFIRRRAELVPPFLERCALGFLNHFSGSQLMAAGDSDDDFTIKWQVNSTLMEHFEREARKRLVQVNHVAMDDEALLTQNQLFLDTFGKYESVEGRALEEMVLREGLVVEGVYEAMASFPSNLTFEAMIGCGEAEDDESNEERSADQGQDQDQDQVTPYSDFDRFCARLWWDSRVSYMDDDVALCRRREALLKKIKNLTVENRFEYLKYKGMVIMEMLGLSYSDIGLDQFREGEHDEEMEAVVSNLESMMGGVSVEKEVRSRIQERKLLIAQMSNADDTFTPAMQTHQESTVREGQYMQDNLHHRYRGPGDIYDVVMASL